MDKTMTHNDAIVEKAVKIAAYFRNNNKNLTKKQDEYMRDLWDIVTSWDYVKENLREYGLA